jgi:uncharacterized protein YjbI with pentapeptide repeats
MEDKKIQLNLDQFSSIIRRGYCDINGDKVSFVIEDENILVNHAEIIEPISGLQTTSATLRHLFIFENCVFEKEISLTSKNLANINSIRFANCQFKNEFYIEKSRSNLEILDECFFHLKASVFFSDFRNLTISNSYFKTELIISGPCHSLDFNRVNAGSKYEIENSRLNLKEFRSRHSNFLDISFKEISISDNSALFNEGNFTNIQCHEFNVNHAIIGHLVHFMKCVIKNYSVDNISPNDKSTPHRYLKFSQGCKIGKASIPLQMFDSVEIEHCSFSEVRLTGNNVSASVFQIFACDLEKFILIDALNRGMISIREITSNNNQLIGFINSDLGKMDFIKCDFSKAILEFQNSKITDAFFAETDFPTKVIMNGEQNYSQAKLVFGQLQTAFQKQGDNIRSLEYQSREIEAHYNDLKKWLLPQFPFVDFNKISLWLNKWSNNFGRYWMRGVIFSFVSGLLFFYALVLSTDEYVLGFTLDFNPDFVQSFLKFMNPIRFYELENLFKKDGAKPWITLNSSSYVWDLAGRIFVAYGFYQTIQAFRRFGRR